MGINNRQAVARDRREWRKTVLEAKVRNGLYSIRRVRTRRKREESYIYNIKVMYSTLQK
jgi:hypothetical protein